MFSRIAKRYAQALFDLAQERRILDEVAQQLADLKNCIEKSQELENFLRDPVLTKDQKRKVIQALFDKRLNPLLSQFLLFLVEKRRLNLTEGICEVFDGLYLDYKNIADIKVVTPFPVEQKQLNTLQQAIRDKFRKEVR